MAGASVSAPRVLFYVQHLLGIGHLARASRIADAMAEDGFAVTLVTGGAPVPGFPPGTIRHEALPPVVASDAGFSGLARPDGAAADDAFLASRRDRLLALFRQLKPDVLVVEAFPFGRRQMRFELLPLLEAAAASTPRPLVVSSVRDILQERPKPGRNEESAALIERFFDLVMVHGDPAFATLEDSFPLADRIAGRVAYTGLVAGAPVAPSAERFQVLISAGGGAAGRALVTAAVGAARNANPKFRWGLIAGPNLPDDDYATALAQAPSQLDIFRFREDFRSLLASADLSVSQAGYNTVCDLLQAGCRSILVPFEAGGETEQTARAMRLQSLGLARLLPENRLGPQGLRAAIEAALTAPRPMANSLNLDGARGAARLLHDRLRRGRSA